MRILILLLLGYLLYRVVRRYLTGGQTVRQQGGNEGSIDEMVQDPVCKTYVPLREAEKRVFGGETYYFCSTDCADEFEKQLKKRKEQEQ
jgi:YHS domain-containing protein